MTIEKLLNKELNNLTAEIAGDLLAAEAIDFDTYFSILEGEENQIATGKCNEAETRKHAYCVIAENLWNAAEAALNEGNLIESIAIGEVYNDWLEICIKKGVM